MKYALIAALGFAVGCLYAVTVGHVMWQSALSAGWGYVRPDLSSLLTPLLRHSMMGVALGLAAATYEILHTRRRRP